MVRIAPIAPPYEAEVAQQLEGMMPPGVPPLLLFRAFVHNLPMATAMREWGAYELSKRLSLSMRDREIIIDRTCVRCGCEYEWGVHVAYFAERVGLTKDQNASLVHGSSRDACWNAQRDQLLIEAVDSLHDTAKIENSLWVHLAAVFSNDQLLDLLMLCGWYHAISYTANGAQLELEDDAPTFAEFTLH
jgi:alkylhydroperoxidase family enzyme